MNQALLALGGTGSLYGRWHTGGRGRLRQDRRDVCRPPSRRARRRVPWPLPGPSAIRRIMPPGPAQPRDDAGAALAGACALAAEILDGSPASVRTSLQVMAETRGSPDIIDAAT
jgi:hypothetical protein